MNEKHVLKTHSAPVQKLRYSEYLGFFASSSSDNSVVIYGAQPPFSVVYVIKVPANPRSFSFCKNRLFVACYDRNVYIYVWNMQMFQFYKKIEQIAESELKSISAQESQFFATGRDRKVYLYSFTRDEEVCEMAEKTHQQDVKCVDYDGFRAVSCGYDNAICFYALDDQGELHLQHRIQSDALPDCVGPVAFVQNCTLWCCVLLGEKLAASGGADGCLRLYDGTTQTACYRIHDGDLYDISAASAGDGYLIATCGADGTVCIMDMSADGKIDFRSKMTHVCDGEINSCCLLGPFVACGGDNGSISIVRV